MKTSIPWRDTDQNQKFNRNESNFEWLFLFPEFITTFYLFILDQNIIVSGKIS